MRPLPPLPPLLSSSPSPRSAHALRSLVFPGFVIFPVEALLVEERATDHAPREKPTFHVQESFDGGVLPLKGHQSADL